MNSTDKPEEAAGYTLNDPETQSKNSTARPRVSPSASISSTIDARPARILIVMHDLSHDDFILLKTRMNEHNDKITSPDVDPLRVHSLRDRGEETYNNALSVSTTSGDLARKMLESLVQSEIVQNGTELRQELKEATEKMLTINGPQRNE